VSLLLSSLQQIYININKVCKVSVNAFQSCWSSASASCSERAVFTNEAVGKVGQCCLHSFSFPRSKGKTILT
jgi:hypothetical protein